MPRTIQVRAAPILLDQLLAAEFGPTLGRSLLAATLDLNPGLAEAGPVIPLGRDVVLPDRPAAMAPSKSLISLFG